MRTHRAALLLATLIVLTGCAATPPGPFTLASSDIDAEGYVPDSARGNVEQYCGDGDNVSPAFTWTGTPAGTESFVLLMTDPNYAAYDHWVVTGIDGDSTSLAAAVDGQVTDGVVGATTRAGGDYVGPCQPDNGYLYTLYALDAVIEGDSSTTRAEALELIDGHVLAEASIEAKRH